MKVRELMAKLMAVDPDIEIIISRDSEGNGYSYLRKVVEGEYIPKWGDIQDKEWEKGETYNNLKEDEKVKSVILFP